MNVGIKVLGCPKNEADCEVLAGLLELKGHRVVSRVEDADIVLIDTCAFIEDAKKESIDEIMDFVEYRERSGARYKIVVKGCLVQRYYEELKKGFPEVDQWIGVTDPEKIVEALETGRDLVPKKPETAYTFKNRKILEKKPYAFVKIADGCERGCAFCAIPLFKGRLKSRSLEDIEREVKSLLENGIKEIILVAQDTTSYGLDLYGEQALPKLLKILDRLEGDFWIRVMYLHPDFLNEEIVQAILKLEKVVKYFDVPVQHGSDRILRLMGRIRTSQELSRMFNHIRQLEPDAVFRTSVIVGFPTETDEDFEKLVEFVEKVRFDKLGAFLYSDEEGTPSHNMGGKVDPEVAKLRQEKLLMVQAEISHRQLERFVGRKIRVLVEDREGDLLIGRGWMDAPEVDGVCNIEGKGKIGDFVEVVVCGHDDYDLWGRIA